MKKDEESGGGSDSGGDSDNGGDQKKRKQQVECIMGNLTDEELRNTHP